MRLSVPLLLWLWRKTLPVTIVTAAAAVAMALLVPNRLQVQFLGGWTGLLALLVFSHSVAVASMQGRPFSGASGYLYSRGFTRDRLWVHHILASAASVLVVWLAAGLVVWTPLRGWVQWGLGNPFYPGAAWLEADFPLRPLPAYGLLLPVLHYSWIRGAQPTRDRWVGPMLVAWAILLLPPLAAWGSAETPLVQWSVPAAAAAAVLLVILGMRLHRRMEVGP